LTENCQWENLAYDNTVIVINNDEELGKYVSCTGDGYLEIDFSEKSLLLASGKTTSGISKITVNDLQQLSLSEYKLDMEILLNDSITAAEQWAIALIVEKAGEESHVELNVNEYPIEIPFTEYFVHWDYTTAHFDQGDFYSAFPCWENLNHDVGNPDYVWGGKVSIINSDEELKSYLTCPEDYPVIDFLRQTLVLTSGTTAFTISGAIRGIVFLKNSANQYSMKATISQTICTAREYWCIAILTPKIEDGAIVTLEINE
jgi:hypothetical protein